MPVVNSSKVENAALFVEMSRAPTFNNLLVDGAPTKAIGRNSKQTSKGAPIVRVMDLTKQAGDTVEVDIFHQLSGTPTMGDRKLEGRGENMTSASMEIKINQGRHMVNAGGKMAQQRTEHDLYATARTLLSDGYLSRLLDQRTLIHLAGERGTLLLPDDIIPLSSHSEFNEIMVNPVLPPTFDRHFFGGDATGLSSLDAADKFTLESVDRLALAINEQKSMRMQPIRLAADKTADADPMFVLYVTPRQMYDFKQSTSGKDIQTLTANAINRSKGFNHPLFLGECFMWNGILIRQAKHYIEMEAGYAAKVSQNNNEASVTTATTAVKTHRAMLIGAQALAQAFGNVGKTSGEDAGYVGTTTEEVDHGNAREVSLRWMGGERKVRFADKNGRANDNGVMILDTAVSV